MLLWLDAGVNTWLEARAGVSSIFTFVGKLCLARWPFFLAIVCVWLEAAWSVCRCDDNRRARRSKTDGNIEQISHVRMDATFANKDEPPMLVMRMMVVVMTVRMTATMMMSRLLMTVVMPVLG